MRVTAVVCALAACGSDPDVPEKTAAWTLAHQGDAASLLAVWGTSTSDVWAVGNRSQAAGTPTIYRYDGATWAAVDSQQPSLDLWWVWGIDDDVWFGGTGGTILRYRDGAFQKTPTPRPSGTVFGIWGGASDDVWAVGAGGGAGGIVWHWNGVEWSEAVVPAGVPATMFKVHGRATNDVWFSGSSGFAMHWDGNALSPITTNTTAPLFSVAVTNNEAIVVGGQSGAAEILESTGGDFAPVNLVNPYRWRGAAARGDSAFAVGEFGLIAERKASEWSVLDQQLIQLNFHAAWIDPDGGLWGVGGKFDSPPQTDGFLIYYGTEEIAEVAL
jgi:hypothetical protein